MGQTPMGEPDLVSLIAVVPTGDGNEQGHGLRDQNR